jgi:serine/threonine protein phosphatase PrpC
VGASHTNRRDPDRNQDVVIALAEPSDGCTAVIVADGIGSWERSAEASLAAATAAAWVLRDDGPGGLDAAFAAAGPAVLALAPGADEPEDHAGTTLLVAVVDGSHLELGYVGNGALLTVAPVPQAAPESGAIRWTNHLMPHIGFEYGREVLTSSYTTVEGPAPRPARITLDLAEPLALLVTSDGIWSDEQNPIARTPDGMRWSPRPPILMKTLELAAALLADLPTDLHPSDAEELVARHLDWLHDHDLLDDDATIGLLLT